jgi:hypothetical protein
VWSSSLLALHHKRHLLPSLSHRLITTKDISKHSCRLSFSHLHATRCIRVSPQHCKLTSSTLAAGRQITHTASWAIRQPFAEEIAIIATPLGLRLNEYGGNIQEGVRLATEAFLVSLGRVNAAVSCCAMTNASYETNIIHTVRRGL